MYDFIFEDFLLGGQRPWRSKDHNWGNRNKQTNKCLYVHTHTHTMSLKRFNIQCDWRVYKSQWLQVHRGFCTSFSNYIEQKRKISFSKYGGLKVFFNADFKCAACFFLALSVRKIFQTVMFWHHKFYTFCNRVLFQLFPDYSTPTSPCTSNRCIKQTRQTRSISQS